MSNALEKARLAREAQEKEAKNRTQELGKRRDQLLNYMKTWILSNVAFHVYYPHGIYYVSDQAREVYARVEATYCKKLEAIPDSELSDQTLSSIENGFNNAMAWLNDLRARIEKTYLNAIGAKQTSLKEYAMEVGFPGKKMQTAIETIHPVYKKLLLSEDEEEASGILYEFKKSMEGLTKRSGLEREAEDIYRQLDPRETNLTLVANYGVTLVRIVQELGLDPLTDYHALNAYDRLIKASKLKSPDVYEALAVLYDAGTKTGIPNPRKAAKCRAKAAKLRAKGFKGYKE